MDSAAAHNPEPPLLVIVGPTASGKTDLALAIARALPVEIVVADSRQVYRGMSIGTAKPDAVARRLVAHHLIDLVDPDQPLSVADWVAAARSVVPEISRRGNLPVLVGGTGLYVTALLAGYDLGSGPPSPQLRRELQATLLDEGIAGLDARLAALGSLPTVQLDRANPRRLVRAIERAGTPDRPNRPWSGGSVRIGLRRPRAILDARINLRAERLFRDGLLEEVAVLLTAGHGPELAPMTGHGYAEAARVLRGEWPLERAVSVTALRTRQYARRQETWFRRDPSIQWLELGDKAADDPVFVDRALGYARELRATEG